MMGDGVVRGFGNECDLKPRRERAASTHKSRKPLGLTVGRADGKTRPTLLDCYGEEGTITDGTTETGLTCPGCTDFEVGLA